MSASSRTFAFGKTARRLALALVLCTGVAGGAAIAAAPSEHRETQQVEVEAGTLDNNWPQPTPVAPQS
jgi:hypothetical protein